MKKPVRAKKHLGQHFLRDENVALDIVKGLEGHQFDQLIEIGPGDGVLSKYLLEKYDSVTFLDVDIESIQHLKGLYPMHRDKFRLQDFLKFQTLPNTAVIGNFPYNISSQIVFKVIDDRAKVPLLVGMFQKEVAERIASAPGSKDYGILSVLTQAYFDVEYLFTVDEHVFDPPPRVKSGVIKVVRKENIELDCDEKLFKAIVKKAFNQRRKMMRNSVKEFLNENNVQLLEPYLQKRPEQLHYTDFVRIVNLI